jgi:hypothetical protein
MQRGRQQDSFAARGDVTQFRHRKGLNIINVCQKRGSRSDFKAEMYSWFIQRRGDTIAVGR